ncbi:hypothetical protein PHLCEN_2v3178 [Hermanssonia centrifuga]|uniref:Uncharacterized protein n=1 Tax=Hermanssonia centrifuga TaxID=98765 RepID=A0A2R6R0X1_9APHY|nr:hypothetical protein PHLCEN_2v3178 [Hermanssonia centrifuga]
MPNQWLDWWCAIQPSPRRTEPVSFEIDLDHPKNLAPQCWAPISKSGPQGISNIVYALGLSYPSAKRQAHDTRTMSERQWHRWVCDVAWVFTQLLQL